MPDFSDRYNTPLTPLEEQEFQQWAAEHPQQAKDTYDYDVRGAWKSGQLAQPGQHGTDQFKKPNHPTFSDESIYNGVDGFQGGHWGNDDSFQATQTNVQMNPDLPEYMKRVEPKTKLVLPQGGNMAYPNDDPSQSALATVAGANQPLSQPAAAPGLAMAPGQGTQPQFPPGAGPPDQGPQPPLQAAQNPAPRPSAASNRPLRPRAGVGGQPALAPQQPQVDPAQAKQQAIDTAKVSAEAAKTAPVDQKRDINQHLSDMTGGAQGLADAYNQLIKQLGGEEKVGDLKLSRQDWGMFMMDFGMRMMANSGSNQPLAAQIGQAGAPVVGAIWQEKKQREQDAAEYNKELRGTARDLAKAALESADRLETQRSSSEHTVWTEGGLWNIDKQAYETGPDGKPLQPNMKQRPQGPYASEVNREALIKAGLPDRVATQVAMSGAKTPSELRQIFDLEWLKLKSGAGLTDKVDIPGVGTKKWKDTTGADRDAWVNDYLNQVYPELKQQPALQ